MPENSAGIFTRLDTVIIRVADIKRARVFYEKAVGLAASFEDELAGLVVYDLGGATSLTLWERKPGENPPPPRSAGTYPIFLAEDADAVRQTLIERGVPVEPLEEGSGVISFGFYDPDGNRLEACQAL